MQNREQGDSRRPEQEKEKPKRPWVVKDYRSGDEDKIIPLFETVFGCTMGPTESERHWRWEFADNPVKPMAIKLAWDKDRLAGQYAANPLRVWIDGQEHVAALSLDTMTHRDYRRQNMFPIMAEELYQDLAACDTAFVYGYPNANSVSSFKKKVGWQMVMPTPVYIRPLCVSSMLGRKLKLGLVSGVARWSLEPLLGMPSRIASKASKKIALREEQAFGDWADDLWQRCSHQHRIWAVRDQRYLRWRYCSRPETTYSISSAWSEGRIVGYSVSTTTEKTGDRHCFLMDLLVDHDVPGAASALLRRVVAEAYAVRASTISALVCPGSRYRNTFLRHLFLPLPERYFPKELYFGGRVLSKALSEGVFNDPHSWYLSWGDHDTL